MIVNRNDIQNITWDLNRDARQSLHCRDSMRYTYPRAGIKFILFTRELVQRFAAQTTRKFVNDVAASY